MFCRILYCFVAKSLFYAIYAVLSRNLFCRDSRALAWRKIEQKILPVEKKGQIWSMVLLKVSGWVEVKEWLCVGHTVIVWLCIVIVTHCDCDCVIVWLCVGHTVRGVTLWVRLRLQEEGGSALLFSFKLSAIYVMKVYFVLSNYQLRRQLFT